MTIMDELNIDDKAKIDEKAKIDDNAKVNDKAKVNDNAKIDEIYINLEKVEELLKIPKAELKRTLKRSYKTDLDYKIVGDFHNMKTTGRPREKILISSSCFERLCVRSRNKNNENARKYIIEQIPDKYKNVIDDSLHKQIKQFKKIKIPRKKPIINPESGLIYVIKSDKNIDDLYNIGKDIDFEKRMKKENSCYNDNIEVVTL